MMLFETMMQHPDKSAQMAAEFARHLRSKKASRKQLGEELAAILERRKECEDLPSRPELSPELAAAARASYAFEIAALDAIFITICRALEAEAVTLTSNKIGALKRQGMPAELAAALDTIKGKHLATIPAAERLTPEDAAALFDGLTRQGFISGPLAAFGYYLAQQSTPAAKPPKNALSWLGEPGEFAYFVQRLHDYNTARYKAKRIDAETAPGRNTTALCLAFGIDEQTRINKVQPALTHRTKPRGRTAEIAQIFETLINVTSYAKQ